MGLTDDLSAPPNQRLTSNSGGRGTRIRSHPDALNVILYLLVPWSAINLARRYAADSTLGGDRLLCGVLTLLLLHSSAARAFDSAAIPGASRVSASFICAQGRSLHATFDNRVPASVTLRWSDGRRMRLWQTRSGSGARYANRNETMVFWSKGTTSFLQEKGVVTYRDCGQILPAPAADSP